MAANRFTENEIVKSSYAIHFCGTYVKMVCNGFYTFITDPASLMLYNFQSFYHCRFFIRYKVYLVIYFLYGYRNSHVARGITEVPELEAEAPGSIGVAPMPGAPTPPEDRN